MSERDGKKSSYEFIKALEEAADPDCVKACKQGPILDLYRIDFRYLPVDARIKQLMRTLMQSAAPYDCSAIATSIGDDTLGAMRQIHSNTPCYLPQLTAQQPSSARGRLYHTYAQANKHHSADRGGGNCATGYVEYTAGTLDAYGWGGNRFRIVFDYLNARLYFAPLHYASWRFSGSQLEAVDKPAAFSGHPNPFFWITDIK
ncbi:TPA: hypothetical protein ACKP22_004040 [Pseudomonas putida]